MKRGLIVDCRCSKAASIERASFVQNDIIPFSKLTSTPTFRLSHQYVTYPFGTNRVQRCSADITKVNRPRTVRVAYHLFIEDASVLRDIEMVCHFCCIGKKQTKGYNFVTVVVSVCVK